MTSQGSPVGAAIAVSDTTSSYDPRIPVPIFPLLSTWVTLGQSPNQPVTQPTPPSVPGAGNIPEQQ